MYWIFFDKVADWWFAYLLKMGLWYRCFLVNFTKSLKTPFLQNTPGRMDLLTIKILESWISFRRETLSNVRVFKKCL